MKQRLVLDLALAVAMAAVPWALVTRHGEAVRLGFFSALLAATAVAGAAGLLSRRAAAAAQSALGATLLATGWLLSFPAGDHIADIGTYILFGALALAAGMMPRTVAATV